MGAQFAAFTTNKHCTPNKFANKLVNKFAPLRIRRGGRSVEPVRRDRSPHGAPTGCSLARPKRMPRTHETACSNHATLTNSKNRASTGVRLGLISPERQITVDGAGSIPGRGPNMFP